MKNPFSYIRAKLARKLSAAILVVVALSLPVSAFAASTVQLTGTFGAANVTAGDTTYKSSVNASYDQEVKFQLFYQAASSADNGKTINSPRVKFTIPSNPGTTQVVSGRFSSANTSTVSGQATVNLNRADAYLQYEPGTAVWKHTLTNGQTVETLVSDSVVTAADGAQLADSQPCVAASVTVRARVMVPGVKVVKQVRVVGTTSWTKSDSAKPGDTLEYLITYTNTGNTRETNVVIRDNLPTKLQYVPGSTYVANGSYPNGILSTSDNVTKGGIIVGNYAPGAGAVVKFQAKVVAADQLTCGNNTLTNVGIAHPEGLAEYSDTAVTTVMKDCPNTPPTTPPATPPTTTTTSSPATTVLPNTGPGDVIGLFSGASAAGAAGHYVLSRRKRQ